MIKSTLVIISLFTIVFAEENNFNSAFSEIYQKKKWGDGVTTPASGSGSRPELSVLYLTYLQNFIAKPHIKKIVELGFGDFEIMKNIVIDSDKKYIGFEAAEQMIKLRKNSSNMEFRLTSSHKINETGDLLICRDVIMHWPGSLITQFIKEVVPKFKYALIVVGYSASEQPMKQIPIGSFQNLNLGHWFPQLEIKLFFGHHATEKAMYLFENPNNQKPEQKARMNSYLKNYLQSVNAANVTKNIKSLNENIQSLIYEVHSNNNNVNVLLTKFKEKDEAKKVAKYLKDVTDRVLQLGLANEANKKVFSTIENIGLNQDVSSVQTTFQNLEKRTDKKQEENSNSSGYQMKFLIFLNVLILALIIYDKYGKHLEAEASKLWPAAQEERNQLRGDDLQN